MALTEPIFIGNSCCPSIIGPLLLNGQPIETENNENIDTENNYFYFAQEQASESPMKISEFEQADAATGGMVIPVVINGENFKLSIAQIMQYTLGNSYVVVDANPATQSITDARLQGRKVIEVGFSGQSYNEEYWAQTGNTITLNDFQFTGIVLIKLGE